MSIYDDVNKVTRNIEQIFQRRRIALYMLSLDYSARALQDFRSKQAQDTYWINRSFTAVDTVFAEPFFDGNTVGWFIAHLQEYGIYLELANDGRYQALRPIINENAKPFLNAAKKLVGG